MDGILNINKPSGMTSFKVVSLVRHLAGIKKVGHAGTLDPLASGVLPVCFGSATRVIEFLMNAKKTYRAVIKLGITTDTYDIEGTVIKQSDVRQIKAADVESALAFFRGAIEQEPPMYSALKYNGQCLYKLARAGITVERGKRQAHIYRLEMLDYSSPVITIEMECSKGTYVRSLANDLGEKLGCGACVTELERLRYGPFDIEGAVSVSELQEAFSKDCWQRLVYPPGYIMKDWESVTVLDEQASFIKNGVPVVLEGTTDAKCCAYDNKGNLLAILNLDTATGKWKSQKVFN
ncbi:MAG TPA: tRNA pseudouridine(55) synthase TruB [Dehalococcoidia bacterium]|nr:tRNA pseudouridine(55) synthase TruB [Dehalococcoidia bacterium]